jgi:hypothetical protein
MTENQNPADIASTEDVEGHKRPITHVEGEEDVEGHKRPVSHLEGEEDVEGHKRPVTHVDGDDVEGHVQPRRDLDIER